MPNIDASLAGFFETRDQYLPRTACIVVMLVLSAVLTFGAVHGEIADIQVLFGQQADKSAFPKLGNILLIVLLNMSIIDSSHVAIRSGVHTARRPFSAARRTLAGPSGSAASSS